MSHSDIFTEIYNNNTWGTNICDEYKGNSGGGSNPIINITTYVPFLQNFIKNNYILSVVDLGCGDFRVSKEIYSKLQYINYCGYDIYTDMIKCHKMNIIGSNFTFECMDFYKYKENIHCGDLCILKDVLQHWKNEDIYCFLDYLITSKKFKYILICNCGNQTVDHNDILETGKWRELSCDYFPLKKYNPKVVYKYSTKEVCLIDIKH